MYIKNKLQQFLKDFRKNKEDKIEQEKQKKKRERQIQKEERKKQSQLKFLSISEREKLLIEEQMRKLEEEKRKVDEEIKAKYLKFDDDHRQIMYRGEDGKLKHISVYRPCTENRKYRLSRY